MKISDLDKVIKAPCSDCCRQTDHEILKSHSASGSDCDGEVHWSTTFDMLECRGCHFISLKRTFRFSEYEDDQIEYFPPPVSRKKPAWADDFIPVGPQGLDALLSEVYSAIRANSRRLAAMGARALLDMVMVDKVKDVGRFDQKLDALESGGFVSKQQRQFLEAALDTGNAASHRGHCPSAEEMNHVLDIVESVISQLYVLPQAAKQLKRSTPKRRKTRKR